MVGEGGGGMKVDKNCWKGKGEDSSVILRWE